MPAGSYQWTRFRAEANTATKRACVVDAALWWGGFYGGTRRQLEFGVTLKPNTHVALLQPGNDLFLVLNRGWVRTLDDNRFEPSFDRGSAKVQYTFRF